MTKHEANRATYILEFISEFTYREGYAPSVREITAAVGLASTSATHHHMRRLERDGLIAHNPRRGRAVYLTDKGREVIEHVERICPTCHGAGYIPQPVAVAA